MTSTTIEVKYFITVVMTSTIMEVKYLQYIDILGMIPTMHASIFPRIRA